MLKKEIAIPGDIPDLVQNVYDDNINLEPEPLGYAEAKKQQQERIDDKEKRAGTFRIDPPWAGFSYNMVGWLDTNITDQQGEAAVRDTDESIEVLLLQQKDDGKVYFLPWLEDGRELPLDMVPDDYLAMALARHRIRLPRILCTPWSIDKTIAELEHLNSELFYVWQESSWLKGELILLLDAKCTADLCGYRLTYDQTYGLICEKEDE